MRVEVEKYMDAHGNHPPKEGTACVGFAVEKCAQAHPDQPWEVEMETGLNSETAQLAHQAARGRLHVRRLQALVRPLLLLLFVAICCYGIYSWNDDAECERLFKQVQGDATSYTAEMAAPRWRRCAAEMAALKQKLEDELAAAQKKLADQDSALGALINQLDTVVGTHKLRHLYCN